MLNGEVYMIRHNVTGRMYIGRSGKLQKRIYQHLCLLRAGKHPVEDMQKDFDEYGEDFTISVLGAENISNRYFEIEMMEKYRSIERGIGYNYKDPHVTNRKCNEKKKQGSPAKEDLINLIEQMTDIETVYAYTFLSKLFKKAV